MLQYFLLKGSVISTPHAREENDMLSLESIRCRVEVEMGEEGMDGTGYVQELDKEVTEKSMSSLLASKLDFSKTALFRN